MTVPLYDGGFLDLARITSTRVLMVDIAYDITSSLMNAMAFLLAIKGMGALRVSLENDA